MDWDISKLNIKYKFWISFSNNCEKNVEAYHFVNFFSTLDKIHVLSLSEEFLLRLRQYSQPIKNLLFVEYNLLFVL